MIEIHCHIMSDDQRKYPRNLGATPAAWVRDLTGEEFLQLMDDAGVDRAVRRLYVRQ